MTVKGQDWASYQSATPVTTGLDFAFIKATEGTGYVNPKMVYQADTARKAGLVVGFYHFVRPGDMKAQAAYFVEHAASQPGDPLFLDWEDAGVSNDQKNEFIAEVKRLRGNAHKVGLYCNQYYWQKREVGGNAGDALWIADYVTPGAPRIQAPWLFHQYSDSPIDQDLGNFADRAALRAWATGGNSPAPAPTPAPNTYTVKSGDTLSGIAVKFNTTVSALAAANGISDPNKIYPGQVLKIPTGSAPAPAPAVTTYTVKSGDTLSGIAAKFHTTVSALAKKNGISNPNKIFPGQKLKI
ncbi:muramidase [Kitasatospora griseola]|uniref:Muramidase n=1 Tax=Kitasatospora griseola TaxID=2064 RepID=A0A0D0PPL0_KITGR|nr:LysM peptidoglycan-binding domain-containing protein [Kitasatospora griseola]KIQ62407.1 muramidase [Kitasatospora griseola]